MKGTMRTHPLDDRGSFAWVADPSEVMQRASCAVVTDSGVLVIDPVDHPDLDAHLMPLGPVSAVVRLLSRHNRDGQAVASRHGVQVVGPSRLNGLDGATAIPIPAMPGWEETALWFPATGLLVCMEAVGTASYFLAHRGDHLGIHPLLRVRPPRGALGSLRPTAIAVGHGVPVTIGADRALADALATSRRGLPAAWLRAARAAFRRS